MTTDQEIEMCRGQIARLQKRIEFLQRNKIILDCMPIAMALAEQPQRITINHTEPKES